MPLECAQVIEADNLTKDYGAKRAVDGLSFTVEPGVVTGFLGPNGSGKWTTMRLILGLDAPTAVPYRQRQALPRPCGSAARSRRAARGSVAPSERKARHHLFAIAQTHGIPAAGSRS